MLQDVTRCRRRNPVLRLQDPATRTYLGSPSLARLPSGDLLATHDYFGPGCPLNHEGEEHLTSVYRSSDNGLTWRNITHIANAYWSTLFVHEGAVYLLGVTQRYGSIVIRRSDNNGDTWTHPRDETCGLLFRGGPGRTPPSYHGAPVPMLLHQGRLYRAFEDYRPENPACDWTAAGFQSLAVSCPADADLLRADSWTMSNRVAFDPAWVPSAWGQLREPGWLEGNLVVAPDNTLRNVIRFNGLPSFRDHAAMLSLSEDGRHLAFDPATGFLDFPGGHTKFTIRTDPVDGGYLTLSNGNLDPQAPTNRSVLSLYRSRDLRHWQWVDTLLQYDPAMPRETAFGQIGFQYVDWLFDGEDLLLLVRTAIDGAHNFHDSNQISFHHIRNFRQLKGSAT